MAAVSLPDNPSIDFLRRRAREVQRAVRRGDADALARAARHGMSPAAPEREVFPLSAAQFVVARECGFSSWPRLKRYLDLVADHRWDGSSSPSSPDDLAGRFCRLACLTYAEDDPGRWEQARRLLADHPAITRTDIWAAATAADDRAVGELLSAEPNLAVRRGGPNRWRPLFYLAYSRLDPAIPRAAVLHTARLLFDAGADPNEGYLWRGLPTPFTLLTGAFGEGEQGTERTPPHPHAIDLARVLLDAGADPNDGQTLYNRMFGPANDHLRLLLAYGLGRGDGGPWKARLAEALDSPAEMLRSQLAWAIDHGFLDRVRLLAEHGVDIGAPLDDGRTPAERAAFHAYPAIVEHLVSRGAAAPRRTAADAFVSAVLRADRAALDRLLAADPGVAEVVRGERPGLIVWAAASGRAEAIAPLAELGFDVNTRSRTDTPVEQPWETALHHAAQTGDLTLARLLLSLGADPNILDARFEATPLGWARHFGHDAMVELLEPLTTQA